MDMNTFFIMIERECRLYVKDRGRWLQPLLFFIMVVGIFAIIFGEYPDKLRENGVGVLWIGVVLSLILSQEALFHAEKDSGCLEMMLLSPHSAFLLCTIKILTHSIAFGLPLLILTLFFGFIFDFTLPALKGMVIVLAICIPSLCLVNAMSCALTVHLKRGGILLAILTLPLMAPVLFLGSMATEAAMSLSPLSSHIALLGALFLLLFMFTPLLCMFSLKIGAEI